MSLHPSVAAVRSGVRRVLAELDPDAPQQPTVLVACSGGADSLALLSAAVFEGHKLGARIIGVTIDHGLQDGSAAHASRVVAQMAAMGADETASATVTVESRGRGTEAAAREARYAVLDQMTEHFGATLVLLGHTRDDQAETVLIGLTRGSGGRALAGMRRAFGAYRRPLLDVSRADTVTACQVEGLELWEDPHNADPAFTRSRVRHTVLPLLEEELGPGVVRRARPHRRPAPRGRRAARRARRPRRTTRCAWTVVSTPPPSRRRTPHSPTGSSGRPPSTPVHRPPSCSGCTSWPWPRCSVPSHDPARSSSPVWSPPFATGTCSRSARPLWKAGRRWT